jgi:hypothetical protein
VRKKIQELERRNALKRKGTKSSKNSHKKWIQTMVSPIISTICVLTPKFPDQVTING